MTEYVCRIWKTNENRRTCRTNKRVCAAGPVLLFLFADPFHGWEGFFETIGEAWAIVDELAAMGAQLVELVDGFAEAGGCFVVHFSEARFEGVAAGVKFLEMGVDAGAAFFAGLAVEILPFVKALLHWFEAFLSV